MSNSEIARARKIIDSGGTPFEAIYVGGTVVHQALSEHTGQDVAIPEHYRAAIEAEKLGLSDSTQTLLVNLAETYTRVLLLGESVTTEQATTFLDDCEALAQALG